MDDVGKLSAQWIAQLKRTQAKNRRLNTTLNFVLTVLVTFITAAFALVVEMFYTQSFKNDFWLLVGSLALAIFLLWPAWHWRSSQGKRDGVVVPVSINQIGSKGWEYGVFPKEHIRVFSPVIRPYRIKPRNHAGVEPVHIEFQLSSAVHRIEKVMYEQHGSTLKVLPVGHFPALFALGYRANLPAETLISEQIKTRREDNRTSVPLAHDHFLTSNLDTHNPEPAPCDIKAWRKTVPAKPDVASAKTVWCEIALVQDKSVEGWTKGLQEFGIQARESADVRVSVGSFLEPPTHDGKGQHEAFQPVLVVSDAKGFEDNGAKTKTLSVMQAAHLVVQAIDDSLNAHPNAHVHVVTRLPRTVAFVAGHLFAERLASNAAFKEMDPWERLTLWGPRYGSTPNESTAEYRDTVIGLVPFSVMADL